MPQRIVVGPAKRRTALCYAQTAPQQDVLTEKLTYFSADTKDLAPPPSYLSILVRAGICLVLIIAMIYGINRAMTSWLN
jgi:hypothetical protein